VATVSTLLFVPCVYAIFHHRPARPSSTDAANQQETV
jgi:hypothetical protein